jgi:NRPS condensation-like uncharacterized protein
MLGATTYNGQMTLTVGYCGKENTNQINAFLEAFIGELPTQ